ncbi:murein biosynthesis integral membrane protein MurJ [Microbacterium aerolatum]|uniref:murein biosynthesis integral membrane protein MurJ n=1 Tax=Microbacterium aerolatum TaxID=153731 RepID=UPI00384A6430
MGLGRASAMIAAGTFTSRITGLLRTVVLVVAINSFGQAPNAFGVANQLPNSIYMVISAGVLTGVIVPQVVRVSAQKDGGHDFLAKLLTLGALIMGVVTLVATLCAPLLISLFANFGPAEHALATQFAYWCIPQLFFYGMFALLGEILNARKMFAPYAWAPIVNNFVSIAGFILFIVLFGQNRNTLEGWDTSMVITLAGTATLGVVAQTVVLVFFWRRAGIPLKFDFRWRGMGLGHMGKLATWTLLTTLIGQAVGIVQSRTITTASTASGEYASVAASQYAWLVYMLPYSMIILAIGTPYFTRISEHSAAKRHTELRADVGQSIRILGLFTVIAVAAVTAAAVPASRVFTNSPAEAGAMAPVLIAYLVSLVPMGVLFIIQRTFYAYGDARTPFVFTVVQGSLVLVLTLVAAATTPIERLAATVALVQSLSGIVQTIIAVVLLRRKIGPLGLGSTWWALTRFILMAIPAGAAGWAVFMIAGGTEGWMLQGMLQGILGAGAIAVVSVLVYVGLLALFRAPELTVAVDAVRRRRG